MKRRDRAGLLTLLVCLLVVVLVTATARDPATDVRRAWDDVEVGNWGELDHVQIQVERVQRTRAATTPYDRLVGSEATLVLVDVRAVVTEEPVAFSEVVLETRDGHQYEPRPEFPALTRTQPGFTRRGTLVFEVPDPRVEGAQLLVDRDGEAFDVYSRAVRVELGLRTGAPPAPGPLAVPASVVEVTP